MGDLTSYRVGFITPFTPSPLCFKSFVRGWKCLAAEC
jgi:hypothetical protein